jgi:hypothetical protein
VEYRRDLVAQVRPWTPLRRITRSTRLWLTSIPAAFSSTVTRGMP